ncbi:MAG: bacteriocin family protein, partial [Planctomycetes bacterium]|nr:bacteriocin family protein [Planctomycetota bacterium]
MKYLMRDGALLSDTQWGQIDAAVVAEAKKELKGRRFLSLAGPLGASVQNVALDVMGGSVKAEADYWATEETEPVAIASRRFVELVTVYADFMISLRDVENQQGAGVQAAMDAAASCARREDELVFYGDKEMGIDGIFTAEGSQKIAISDWNEGENPVLDVTKALEALADAGMYGERALIVSTDLWGKLHRIQPGTGVMEIERVKGMV